MAETQVSEEEKQRFLNEGFLVIRKLIPEEVIEELRVGYDKATRGEVDVDAWRGQVAPGRTLQLGFPSQHIPEWINHPYRNCIVNVGKQLLGDDIEYSFDQLIYKPPHDPVELLWHQDAGYGWPGKANERGGTCWLAFSDVTKEMGTLQFIPGSHTRGIVKHVDATDRNPIHDALEAEADPGNAVVVEYEVGDATFHHGRTRTSSTRIPPVLCPKHPSGSRRKVHF